MVSSGEQCLSLRQHDKICCNMNLVLEFWTSGEERPAHRGSMTEVNYIDQAGGNQGRKWVALAKERDTLSIAKDGLMMGFLA